MYFGKKVKKIHFVFILLITILTPAQKVCAEEVYVYCVSKGGQWYWLANKTVKVSGEWKYLILNNIKYFRYFKVDGDKSLLLGLKNQCKNEFGQDFIYVQPGVFVVDDWHVFGYADGKLEPGISDYLKQHPRFRK